MSANHFEPESHIGRRLPSSDQPSPDRDGEELMTGDSALLRDVLALLGRCHGPYFYFEDIPSYVADDHDRNDFAFTLRALGPQAAAAAETVLVAYLRDRDPRLNVRAMRALCNIVSQSTPMFHALSVALCHYDPSIRLDAYKAVQYVGNAPQSCVQSLIFTLEHSLGHDRSRARYAIQALGAFGPNAAHAAPILLDALNVALWQRESVADVLFETDTSAEVNHDSQWNTDITAALRSIGHIAIVTVLHDGRRRNRLPTLALILGARAVAPLELALNDHDWEVRVAALKALGHIADDAASAYASVKELLLCDWLKPECVREVAARTMMCFASKGDAATAADALSTLNQLLLGRLCVRLSDSFCSAFMNREYVALARDLVAALSESDPKGRISAAERLVILRVPEVVPALVTIAAGAPWIREPWSSCYRGEVETVRVAAIDALSRMGDIAAMATVPVLVREMKGSNQAIVNAAVTALKRFGPLAKVALPSLCAQFRGAQSDNPLAAGDALSGIPGGPAVLVEALHDHSVDVRRRAATALRGTPPADNSVWVATLLNLLNDKDDDVRQAVVAMLADRAQDAFPPLIDALRNGYSSIRPAFIWGLEQMVTTMPLEHLRGAAALLHGCLTDPLPEVRASALALLFKRPHLCDTALQTLYVALRDSDRSIRQMAVSLLVRLSPSGIPVLIDALCDTNDDVRLDAVTGLVALGGAGASAITPLARLLGDPICGIRKAAYDALVGVGRWESEFGQRMKSDVVLAHKKLHVFRLMGEILLAQGVDTMAFGQLEQILNDLYRQEISQPTLRNYRDDVNELFRRYRGEPDPVYHDSDHRRTSVDEKRDFFDRRQGKPFRILRKGWESWGETKLYFAILEGQLQNFPVRAAATGRDGS